MDTVTEKIGAYWDQRSETFDTEHDTEDLNMWRKTLCRLLGASDGKNVLDLGTGTGFLANMTAELGFTTVGADVSREMLRRAAIHAQERTVGAIFMYGDAASLPFTDESFDNVVNARLIWTLVEPEMVLREWYRVLRPGGSLFCFNRMEEGFGLTAGRRDVYGDEEVRSRLAVANAKMDELIALLLDAGFVNVRLEKLAGLTRPEYDFEPWFVLMGSKN